MSADPLLHEIAGNFDYFQRTLTQHLEAHEGEFALIRSRRIRGYFASVGEVDREGWSRFADHLYSIQQVTPEPVELGLYSNAGD